MSVSFSNLAISIGLEKDDGTLKRPAGTPMPKASYFIGKLGMVYILAVVELVLMLTKAHALISLRLEDRASNCLPRRPSR
jgi:ABC-2 type transport system permease protein